MKSCLFIISKRFGLACLQKIVALNKKYIAGVVTIDDSQDTRTEYMNIKSYCKSFDLKLYTVTDTKELYPLIETLQPDLAVVICWYKLFPEDILHKIPLGFITFHFSLLPKYRGGAPVVWSIINDEQETGFSLFQIDAGMDTGQLYAQECISIEENDSINDVLKKIECKALQALEESFVNIIHQKIKPFSQKGIPSYAAQRRPADGMINWNWSQKKIYNFIRAQSTPYPGAFTLIKNERFTIMIAKISEEIYYAMPGHILNISGNFLKIACGDNKTLLCYFDDVSLNLFYKNGKARFCDSFI